MLKISVGDFDSLSEDEKGAASNKGSGKEYASYLRVELNGVTIALKSDAMEPEDARFYRDLRWIPQLLRQCYEIGQDSCPLYYSSLFSVRRVKT